MRARMNTCGPLLRRHPLLQSPWYGAFLAFCTATSVVPAGEPLALRAEPSEIRLAGPLARVQLVVTAPDGQGVPFDVTRSVTCRCLTADLLSVSDSGLVTPLRECTG